MMVMPVSALTMQQMIFVWFCYTVPSLSFPIVIVQLNVNNFRYIFNFIFSSLIFVAFGLNKQINSISLASNKLTQNKDI